MILSVVVIAGIFSAIYKPDNGMLNSIFSLFAGRDVMVLWKDQPMVIVSVIILLGIHKAQAHVGHPLGHHGLDEQERHVDGGDDEEGKGGNWQNFVDAWNAASMGSYMINSVIVTALALAILLVVALPAA